MIWKSIFRGLGTFLFFILFQMMGYAQVTFSGDASIESYLSTKKDLPFWFYSNKRGRVNAATTFSAWSHITANYEFSSNSNIEFGVGAMAQDAGRHDNFDLDELYLKYDNKWLRAVVGIKQHAELYDGLSGTNGNMLWSINAKPLPGIELKIREPIYFLFNNHVGLSGSWGEFLMGDGPDRFVKNTRVHKKSLFLNYRSSTNFKLKIGIEHFAQWAGESPEDHIGEQPRTFKDYLRIVTGQGGESNSYIGEQTNALGNHLGSYELRISKVINNIYYEFMYSHLFEDGSGMLYYNRPDGRYGLYIDLTDFTFNDKTWIQKFMYEFYYTKDQSHKRSPLIHKWDNYFNNGMFQSGWTYKGDVIGMPFFTINQYGNDKKPSIGNNRIIVHHFGILGTIIQKFPYKLLISYRNNNGHVRNLNDTEGEEFREDDPRGRFTMPHKLVSALIDLSLLDSFIKLNVQIGADLSSEDSNLGAGLRLSKQF